METNGKKKNKMFLESLLRLAEIVDYYEKHDEVLVSKKFQDDTKKLIESQNKFLMEDLKFLRDNPGPYDMGFGNFTMTIYSPNETEIQEWAMISRNGTCQKNYRFNSIIGLIKALSMSIDEFNESNELNKKETDEK